MTTTDQPYEPKALKCIGIFGRLFGHKFKLNYADYSIPSDFCTRCGVPSGSYLEEKRIEDAS